MCSERENDHATSVGLRVARERVFHLKQTFSTIDSPRVSGAYHVPPRLTYQPKMVNT
jgi:hypothetical protein